MLSFEEFLNYNLNSCKETSEGCFLHPKYLKHCTFFLHFKKRILKEKRNEKKKT
eukprot:UN09249